MASSLQCKDIKWIYVVTAGLYEENRIVGVFRNYEQAYDFIIAKGEITKHEKCNQNEDEGCTMDFFYIKEERYNEYYDIESYRLI